MHSWLRLSAIRSIRDNLRWWPTCTSELRWALRLQSLGRYNCQGRLPVASVMFLMPIVALAVLYPAYKWVAMRLGTSAEYRLALARGLISGVSQ
jgi:hypothetical protein